MNNPMIRGVRTSSCIALERARGEGELDAAENIFRRRGPQRGKKGDGVGEISQAREILRDVHVGVGD